MSPGFCSCSSPYRCDLTDQWGVRFLCWVTRRVDTPSPSVNVIDQFTSPTITSYPQFLPPFSLLYKGRPPRVSCIAQATSHVTFCMKLSERQSIKTYRGSGGKLLRIEPGTRWRRAISFALRPLYSRYFFFLDGRLDGPHSRSGRGGEKRLPTFAGRRTPVAHP